MKVTAKTTLSHVADDWGGNKSLHFSPDYLDGRNAEWAAATPALSLQMTVKPEVADLFEGGGKYTLTFEPTED